jgi:hypothetical protein
MPGLGPRVSKVLWVIPLGAMVAIAAGLAWRSQGRAEVEGQLREGSLRCQNACKFELVLETSPATIVHVDSCIMPDTLRDWPGVPVHLMAAGTWQSEGRLHATALLTREGHYEGPKPSSGRPPECFIPR